MDSSVFKPTASSNPEVIFHLQSYSVITRFLENEIGNTVLCHDISIYEPCVTRYDPVRDRSFPSRAHGEVFRSFHFWGSKNSAMGFLLITSICVDFCMLFDCFFPSSNLQRYRELAAFLEKVSHGLSYSCRNVYPTDAQLTPALSTPVVLLAEKVWRDKFECSVP